jgi:alkylation response protein AidB-like acyl-CoA dehydrogenase
MRRLLFGDGHETFRSLARDFYLRECVPHVARWESNGVVDREVWLRAGAAGLLGFDAPAQFGGVDIDDFRYKAILAEEMYLTGAAGVGFVTHNNVVGPYLNRLTTIEQRGRWLPGYTSGELICALAISEPDAGSDVARIRTTAKRTGDTYVLNGSKMFVTNGILADLIIVAAKTTPAAGHRGVSLLGVEASMPGVQRGRPLDKVGQRSRDTAPLYFDNVQVPAANLIGQLDRGFYHMMENLPEERLTVAVIAAASMERALSLTVEHVRNRQVFGEPLGALQATRFTMAELQTDVEVARTYVDSAVRAAVEGQLTAAAAASVKYWSTDMQFSVLDRCVQLFGGYGYMNEYEITRLWRDSRVQRIYAGSNEVMKDIIGKAMELDRPPRSG